MMQRSPENLNIQEKLQVSMKVLSEILILDTFISAGGIFKLSNFRSGASHFLFLSGPDMECSRMDRKRLSQL